MAVSVRGKLFPVITRATGNDNPIVINAKKKNVVKDLRSMEPLFR